jgi:hypothetical protein
VRIVAKLGRRCGGSSDIAGLSVELTLDVLARSSVLMHNVFLSRQRAWFIDRVVWIQHLIIELRALDIDSSTYSCPCTGREPQTLSSRQ